MDWRGRRRRSRRRGRKRISHATPSESRSIPYTCKQPNSFSSSLSRANWNSLVDLCTELRERMIPRLREITPAARGGITQPRVRCFAELCRCMHARLENGVVVLVSKCGIASLCTHGALLPMTYSTIRWSFLKRSYVIYVISQTLNATRVSHPRSCLL